MVFSAWTTVQDSDLQEKGTREPEPCDWTSCCRGAFQATVRGGDTQTDPAISLKEES